MQPSPPGICVAVRGDAVELAIARPGRVRRALVVACATGAAFGVAAVGVVLDTRAPKAVLFVLATFLSFAFGGAIRALLLGRRPLRLVLDEHRLLAVNERPWSRENVRLPRAAIDGLEQTPAGIAARLRDGTTRPLVRDLTFDQVRFVEQFFAEEIAQRT